MRYFHLPIISSESDGIWLMETSIPTTGKYSSASPRTPQISVNLFLPGEKTLYHSTRQLPGRRSPRGAQAEAGKTNVYGRLHCLLRSSALNVSPWTMLDHDCLYPLKQKNTLHKRAKKCQKWIEKRLNTVGTRLNPTIEHPWKETQSRL